MRYIFSTWRNHHYWRGRRKRKSRPGDRQTSKKERNYKCKVFFKSSKGLKKWHLLFPTCRWESLQLYGVTNSTPLPPVFALRLIGSIWTNKKVITISEQLHSLVFRYFRTVNIRLTDEIVCVHTRQLRFFTNSNVFENFWMFFFLLKRLAWPKVCDGEMESLWWCVTNHNERDFRWRN